MKILKLIDDSFEKVLCAILFTAMVLCIVWQLIMRWTGGNLSWTEEAARYIFIWLAWIGMSEAVRQRKHIKVEFATAVAKGAGRLFFDLLSNVAFIIFCVVTFVWSGSSSTVLPLSLRSILRQCSCRWASAMQACV